MSQSSHQVRRTHRLAHLTGVLLLAGTGLLMTASPAAANGMIASATTVSTRVGVIAAADRDAAVPMTLGAPGTAEQGLVENAVAGTEVTAGSSSAKRITFTATPAVAMPDTSSSSAVLVLACAGLLLCGITAYFLAHKSHRNATRTDEQHTS